MELHLSNGRTRKMPVGANPSGHRIEGVTFDFNDVRSLLSMEDEQLRDYLEFLFIRFPPQAE